MSRVPFRPAAALAVAAGLFLALPGCSGGQPPPDKKDKDKGGPNATGGPNGDGKTDPGPARPVETAKVDFNTGVGKEAMDFLKSVTDGTVRADRLSLPFLKAIGLPAELPSDKAKGYSEDAAVSWLKRVGGVGFGPTFPSTQVGDVALIRGGLVGDGRYALRLVRDGGAWKVDYLGLTSARLDGPPPAAAGEAALQEFVAAAFADVLADRTAMPPPERAMAAAALMTPALRARWAEPLGSDKTGGFDYSRGGMGLKLKEFAADAVAVAPQGDATFRVEFARGTDKRAFAVKLAKDAATGRWLVDDVTPR
jgi:hypothetical protein